MDQTITPVIRLATAADSELLAELGIRTFSETFAAYNRPEDMIDYLAAAFCLTLQTAELAEPDSVFLIAEVEGVASGYAKLKPGKPPAGVTDEQPIELVRLYVSEDWIGHGVGSALIEVCLERARQKGHRIIWLGVWEHNNRARAFYRKWKFRDVGMHIFQLGADAQTDILMERCLDTGV